MSCPYEDVVLFARGLYGRHGAFALSMAKERASEFRRLGDDDGFETWEQVSGVVAELVASERRQERPAF